MTSNLQYISPQMFEYCQIACHLFVYSLTIIFLRLTRQHETMKKILLGGLAVSIGLFFLWIYTVGLTGKTNSSDEPDPPRIVPNILLVSTWRSGSTWTGAFLKALPETFYLYEPLHALRDPKARDQGFYIPPETSISLIKQVLQCAVPETVSMDATKWPALYKPKHLCLPKSCDLQNIMIKSCIQSKRKAMKTVRLRLGSVEELLNLQSINPLKVIYLVRDPRAIFESMHEMKNLTTQHWTLSPRQICTKLYEDSHNFQTLNQLYPGRFLFMRYEDLTIDPESMLKRLAHFVEEDESILDSWRSLVHVKAFPGKKNKHDQFFSINTKSITDWESWRPKVPAEIVRDVQRACIDAMKEFGYKSMTNMEKVRSMQVPSITSSPCLVPPCL